MASGSSRMVPTFLRGLSEPKGFWNTICTTGRSARRAEALAPTTSVPAIFSVPREGGSIIATMRARVDLPQPDSPTTAKVLPAASVKLTSATACRVAVPRMRPRRTP